MFTVSCFGCPFNLGQRTCLNLGFANAQARCNDTGKQEKYIDNLSHSPSYIGLTSSVGRKADVLKIPAYAAFSDIGHTGVDRNSSMLKLTDEQRVKFVHHADKEEY